MKVAGLLESQDHGTQSELRGSSLHVPIGSTLTFLMNGRGLGCWGLGPRMLGGTDALGASQ